MGAHHRPHRRCLHLPAIQRQIKAWQALRIDCTMQLVCPYLLLAITTDWWACGQKSEWRAVAVYLMIMCIPGSARVSGQRALLAGLPEWPTAHAGPLHMGAVPHGLAHHHVLDAFLPGGQEGEGDACDRDDTGAVLQALASRPPLGEGDLEGYDLHWYAWSGIYSTNAQCGCWPMPLAGHSSLPKMTLAAAPPHKARVIFACSRSTHQANI